MCLISGTEKIFLLTITVFPFNPKCCSTRIRRQLDRNLTFHKMVAWMIALHTGKFIQIFEIAKKTWNQSFPSKILLK